MFYSFAITDDLLILYLSGVAVAKWSAFRLVQISVAVVLPSEVLESSSHVMFCKAALLPPLNKGLLSHTGVGLSLAALCNIMCQDVMSLMLVAKEMLLFQYCL